MNPYITPNPFLSPIYGNYMQQQFSQPQQTYQQPTQQPIGISGRYVNDFNEITASDIPMNSPAIFAKNDRSEIQLREWNANGQITTTSFKVVPIEPTEPPEPIFKPSDLLTPMMDKLAELEDKIDKLTKPTAVRKKEGE